MLQEVALIMILTLITRSGRVYKLETDRNVPPAALQHRTSKELYLRSSFSDYHETNNVQEFTWRSVRIAQYFKPSSERKPRPSYFTDEHWVQIVRSRAWNDKYLVRNNDHPERMAKLFGHLLAKGFTEQQCIAVLREAYALGAAEETT